MTAPAINNDHTPAEKTKAKIMIRILIVMMAPT
jgi:hypothetical protein